VEEALQVEDQIGARRTSHTAPSLKSWSNFLCVSPIGDFSPLRGTLHGANGIHGYRATIAVAFEVAVAVA
jgi:hypothetical protein